MASDKPNSVGAGCEFLAVEKADDGISVVRLQRPERRNALNLQLKREPQEAPLTAALAHGRRLFQILFASDDPVEGMQTFLDRRPARFTGR